MEPSEPLVVYDVAGPRGQQVIAAARELAEPVDELRCFWDFEDPEGGRIGFWGPGDVVVASFPGWYRADCDLARFPDGWLPLPDKPGERWEDFDRESYLSTQRDGDWVYLFQSDLVELSARVEGTAEAVAGPAPGTVEVNGIEGTWYRIGLDAFQAAWATAQGQAKRIVAQRGGDTP